jgi:hypothetical protein
MTPAANFIKLLFMPTMAKPESSLKAICQYQRKLHQKSFMKLTLGRAANQSYLL